MHVISEEVNGGDIGNVHAPLHFHRVRWNFRLVYGFDDSEVTLVTSSFSLLSKPILYLFQIKWAFHWMNLNWIGSTSHLRSHNVVDRLYSHSKALDRAENDGRSGHDLDLHGHERDAIQALKQSYCILSQSVYSMAISHGSSCSRDPPILSMPFRAIPSPAPPPIPSSSPTVSVSIPDLKYPLPCVPTIFRINRERAVDPSLSSSPLEW